MRPRLLALALCVLATPLAADESAAVQAGPVRLEVQISRTAHLFHVVDQVSGWSEYCHAQYRRAFEAAGGLSEEDRAALARHAEIRKRKGWGGGLEQALYTPLPLDKALAAAVAAKHLTQDEADTERAVLLHFAARVDRLLRERNASVLAFRDQILSWRERLEADLSRLARLCGTRRLTVPIYLLANPSDSSLGGGFNGGRLTLEVGATEDTYGTLLHELFHALLAPHRDALEKAAKDVPGLDAQTIGEGLCYALAPGIVHDGPDRLATVVARDLAAGKRLSDSFVRFNRLGLALRPMLRAALEDEKSSLDALLPRVVDVWRALVELDGASSRPAAHVFGPGWDAATKRLQRTFGMDVFSYNHDASAYEKALAAAPSGPLVLLFAADQENLAMPERFRDLLPVAWDAVQAALREGKTLEIEGRARDRRVVLLVAPTKSQLDDLVEKTALLAKP